MDSPPSRRWSRWLKELDPYWFRVVALALVLGLYLPWFFLPVASIGRPMPGWDVCLAMFIFPFTWPLAAGHVLLWLGTACLGMMRCKAARNFGMWALVVTLLGSLIFQSYWPATGFKIAGMVALTVAGVVGDWLFGKMRPLF